MWPLIERELRIALREKAVRQRWLFALAGGGIALVFLLLGAGFGVGVIGPQMFRLLLWIGAYVSLVPVLNAAADCFSQERRSGTLSLLFLAGLKPSEIFVSKLSGLLVRSVFNLLGLVPFFALPFLGGGISLECFLATNVLLFNLLLFALAVSVFGSVLCRDDGAAFAVAVIIGGLLCGLGPALWYAINWLSTGAIGAGVLRASPLYGMRLVYLGLPPGTSAEFWITSGVTAACSLTALTASVLILRFTWQDHSTEYFASVRRWFHRDQRRHESRSLWLDQNAFAWLIVRDRVVVKMTGLLLAVIAALWAAAAATWPHRFATPLNALVTAGVVNAMVMFAVAVAAARRFGYDRSNGAFELLLTTPLNTAEVVGDYHAGLREQFRPLARRLAVGNAMLAAMPLFLHSWPHWRALIVYALCWAVLLLFTFRQRFSLASLAMWVSLNTGRPVHSALRTLHFGWVWFWIAFQFFNGRLIPLTFPSGSVVELVLVSTVAFVMFIIIAAGIDGKDANSEWLLARYFRHLAASPVPSPSDPRWKRWDMKEPFPSYEVEAGRLDSDQAFLTQPNGTNHDPGRRRS